LHSFIKKKEFKSEHFKFKFLANFFSRGAKEAVASGMMPTPANFTSFLPLASVMTPTISGMTPTLA